jgi:hypothetical protein
MSPQSAGGVNPRYMAYPTRESADYKLSIRQPDWSGGWNRLYYQSPIPYQFTEPRFWDAFNVETAIEGEIRLAPLFERVQADGSDVLPDVVLFNNAAYKLPNSATPVVMKTTDGVTWNNVSMASGPTTAIRGSTSWRNFLFVAATSNTIYRLDTSDVWTAITPPTGVVANADMVGVSPDDKLMAWFNGKGLYQTSVNPPAASDWSKVWPPSTDPDEPQCDLLDGSTGTVIIATSDSRGSSLHEYFTAEGAATAASMVTWINVPRASFYRVRLYDDAAYIGAKIGVSPGATQNGQGILYRKERGAKPTPVQEFGDGIRGQKPSLDFGVRALVADDSYLWIGAPSRAANLSGTVGVPCVYRYTVDDTGVESVGPDSATDTAPGNAAGKVYGAVILNGDVIIATSTGMWKRSPTKKSLQGYLDSSIYDLRAPDHTKIFRFTELQIEDASATETVAAFYRTGTITGSWLGGTTVTASGPKKINFPDDDPTQGKYRLSARQLQAHFVLSRGADPLKMPRLMSMAIDTAQIRPVEVSS